MKRLLLTLALVAYAVSYGETKTYTGADNGDWFADGNWDPEGVPTAADDVMIEGKRVKAQTGAITANSLTMAGESELHLGKATLEPGTIATIENDLSVTDGAKLYVYAGALTDLSVFADSLTDHAAATAAIYANPTVVSVGGTFTVEGGAVVYPENEPLTGAAVFFKPADFVLAADGEINVGQRGWDYVKFDRAEGLPAGARLQIYAENIDSGNYYKTYAFGAGHAYGGGGGYGGNSYVKRTVTWDASKYGIYSRWESGYAYGNAYAPFLPGSQAGIWGSGYPRGSGSIVVLATGDVTLAGTLNADGVQWPPASYANVSGPSGGGIWICGRDVEIADTATLTANGSTCYSGYSGVGGGGRIAICDGMAVEDWGTLAALAEGAALPAGFVSQELSKASVAGALHPSDLTKKGQDGTKVYVASMSNKAQLFVVGNPLNAISEGVTYGQFVINCGEELVYTSGEFGKDPLNPTGTAYPSLGWVVSNATAEVASDVTREARFTPVAGEGPYTLTWKWGDGASVRNYNIDRAGGGMLTVNGTVYTESFQLPVTDPTAVDTVVATPADGYRFLGWVGLKSGFSTNPEQSIPVEIGGTVTALFESENPTYTVKRWAGGTSVDEQSWDDPNRWVPTGVPTLGDDVEIETQHCHVPFAAIAHSITVAAGKKLSLFATPTSNPDYNQAPGYGGSFTAEPRADTSDVKPHRHLFVAGDFTVEGTVVIGGEQANYTNLSLTVGGNVTLNGAAKMSVCAAPLDEALPSTSTNLYYAATVFSIGGDLVLNDTAGLYPWCDSYTGTAVCFAPSNLTLAAGATVSAESRGWYWRPCAGDGDPLHLFTSRYESGNDKTTLFETRGPGTGNSYSIGAGHGNFGGAYAKAKPQYANPYGDACAPFLPGSSHGTYGDNYPMQRGGGVVWFNCKARMTLNGTVNARGTRTFYGGPSGGSVWLIGRSLVAGSTASVTAQGGGTAPAQAYTSSGSGGRVSLLLGASADDIEALAMGERPETLEYAETIDALAVNVSGGENGTSNGAKPQTYAPTGTVTTVKGPYADKAVMVTASPKRIGAPEPGYGQNAGAVGETLHFVATDDGFAIDEEASRWQCVGYVVSNATEELAYGLTASFDFTMPNSDISVTWLWGNRQRRLVLENPQGAAFGTVKLNGAASESGASVWVAEGEVCALEAVPAEGYEFLYWIGDFPYGHAKDRELSLPITAKNVSVRPLFRLREEPAVRTFAGAATGDDFIDATKWSGGNIPGLEDEVVIASGVCRAPNYVEVARLSLSGSGQFWSGAMPGTNYKPSEFKDRFDRLVSTSCEEAGVVVTGDVTLEGTSAFGVGVPSALNAATCPDPVAASTERRPHGRLEAANVTVKDSASLMVVGGTVEGDFTFATGAGFLKTGVFSVEDTAVYRPISDPCSGGSVVAEVGAFFLAEGAKVDAKGAGYFTWTETAGDDTLPVSAAPGLGFTYTVGAGYGGRSGSQSPDLTNRYGKAYGFAEAPVHPGSPNGTYNNPFMRGGGLVRIHARQSMDIRGTVDVSAEERAWTDIYFFGGASGGGIWLTAPRFAFGEGAVLDAHGGHATYDSAGGGGRIAICETADEAAIAQFAETGRVRNFSSRKTAQFGTLYPGVTVNVKGGGDYTGNTSDHQFVKQSGEDGTFRYVKPTGVVLIVR